MSYCPYFKIRFPDFSRLCFHISEWKLVASFHMKSYRSSSNFVTVDQLFHELLPFVRNSFFLTFFVLFFHISEWKLVASFHMKSYRSSLTFVMIDLLFHELLSFVKKSWPFLQKLFSGLFLVMLSYIWIKVGMKVGRKLLYEELHIKFETSNNEIKTQLMDRAILAVLY